VVVPAIVVSCADGIGPSEQIGAVTVSAPATEISVGSSLQLMASVLNSSGVAMPGQSVQWSSQDTTILSVSSGGVVTGRAGGSATVTASSGSVVGTIAMTVRFGPCTAATATAAGTITSGQTVNGILTRSDCVLRAGHYADGWLLTVTSPATIRVDLTSSQFDALLHVTDAAMNLIAVDDDGGEGTNSRLYHNFMPGSYVIWATTHAPGETGTYALSMAPVTLCSAATTAAAAVGSTVSGTLTQNSCILPHGNPGAGWRVSLTTATALSVTLRSTSFAPLLVATDLQLIPLAFAMPYSPDTIVQLVQHFPPGEYVLWATSPEGGVGPFTMSVETARIPVCDRSAGAIAPGQTRSGTLTGSSCRLPDGRVADPWQLTLAAPATLRIDLTSQQFDAFLILTDQAGGIVASDDDGGEGVNARIVRQLPAGSYTIWATTWVPGMTGAYQLAVQPSSGGAAARLQDISLLNKAGGSAPRMYMGSAGGWLDRWTRAGGK
jgi:hypothetical protein